MLCNYFLILLLSFKILIIEWMNLGINFISKTFFPFVMKKQWFRARLWVNLLLPPPVGSWDRLLCFSEPVFPSVNELSIFFYLKDCPEE